MAFVRTKRVRGNEYHQLVESYREDGKMRQRVVVHLGKSTGLKEAIEYTTKELAVAHEKRQALLKEREGILEELRQQLPAVLAYHGDVPPRLGEFKTVAFYKRIAGNPYWASFPYSSSYGRSRGGYHEDYYGYYGFMAACCRYWNIPKEVEKAQAHAARIGVRLDKLKAAEETFGEEVTIS